MKQSIAFWVLLILPTCLLAKNQYSVYSFPSGYIVTAINSSGEVVGTVNDQPFVWTRSGGSEFLGNLGGGPTYDCCYVSDNGAVTGASILPNGVTHAFLWTATTGMQDLGSILGGQSLAFSINDNGEVAGISSTPDGTITHAFFWSQQTGSIDIGPLSGYSYSQPNALSDNGEIAGVEWSQNGPTSGFSWTLTNGLQPLPNLGGSTTAPIAINDSEQMAGVSSYAEGNWHAALWASDGNIQDLGTLAGDNSSRASYINASGHVAGQSWGANTRIFFWTPANGMTDIGTIGTPQTSLGGLNNRDQIVGNDSGKAKGGGLYLWSPALGLQKISAGSAHPIALNDAGQFLASKSLAYSANELYTPIMNVTLTSSLNPSVKGQSVTFTANVRAIVGVPPDGEQVAFYNGSKLLGSGILSSGVATFTTSTLSAGTHSILASYTGDNNYEPSKSLGLKQMVNK